MGKEGEKRNGAGPILPDAPDPHGVQLDAIRSFAISSFAIGSFAIGSLAIGA